MHMERGKISNDRVCILVYATVHDGENVLCTNQTPRLQGSKGAYADTAMAKCDAYGKR